MQTAERAEFEDLIGRLCAEYAQPASKARKEAYWTGLAKMSLAQLARCVDFAVGEHGPDELPTAKGLWKIHRQLRGDAGAMHTSAPHIDEQDHLEFVANRLLYGHLLDRGGVGQVELAACLKAKRELVNEFMGYVREGDVLACPHEFVRRWILILGHASHIDPQTLARWRGYLEHPLAFDPYPPSMARELKGMAA